MRRDLTHRVPRFTLLVALLAGLALAASGCVLEVGPEDDPYYGDYVADLEVDWSISGSSAAALCDAYGIERWRVLVDGPEPRTVTLDCRADWWSTEGGLYSLSEGTYAVEVQAVSPGGHMLVSEQTSLELYDDGYIQSLHFKFYPSDF